MLNVYLIFDMIDTLHTTHEKLKKEYQEYPISVPKQKPSEFFNDRKPSNCGDDANVSNEIQFTRRQSLI